MSQQEVMPSTSSAKTKRLIYIDAAKCVAVIGNAIGHTQGLPWVSPVVDWLDNMLLPLFWVAAGYTSSMEFKLGRRFRAIIGPYIWMSLICLVYSLVCDHGELPDLWWAGILYGRFRILADAAGGEGIRLMVINNAVLWFLPSLFTGYAVYGLLLRIKAFRWQAVAALGSLGVAAVMCYVPILLPWSVDVAFFVAPLMWCGGVAKRFDLINKQPLLLFIICVCWFAIFNHFTGATNYSLRNYGAYGPICAFCCALPGSLVFLLMFRMAGKWKLTDWLAWLNADSLYIFGLQLVFFNLAGHLGSRLSLPEHLTVSIQLIVAIAGGWICGRIIGRITGKARKLHK